MSSGMLALIGSSNNAVIFDTISETLSDDVGVALGGLMGANVGDSYGSGGLGVVGGVEGGVVGGSGSGAVGLGGLGGLGTGTGTGVVGPRTTVKSCLRRVLPRLEACIASTTRLSIDVRGGVVTGVTVDGVSNACAADVTQGVPCDVDDGAHSLVIRKR